MSDPNYDPWSRGGSGEPQGLGGYGQPVPPPAEQPYGYPPPPAAAPTTQPGKPTPATPGTGRDSESNGSRKTLAAVLLAGAGLVIVGALLLLGFVWPGGGLLVSQTFERGAVEAGVAQIITDVYRAGSVGAVDCPANQEVRSGSVFTCLVTVDGEPRRVEVTVLNDNGEYEVGNPY
ncbi:DUF4333 domain-containing protein [Hoyosella altamirensis]|uniref:DUF4333 domain-containing protein n=1 Tax=Hoyosella altamirensis TaxID=616997 RepID=A0A839RMM4_9ACTN|nr:DUF4333 domain-containing protein [Hoyosella altamirensis]MBB3037273.1 hypothetical protein [Hoyosella altamirensis]